MIASRASRERIHATMEQTAFTYKEETIPLRVSIGARRILDDTVASTSGCAFGKR